MKVGVECCVRLEVFGTDSLAVQKLPKINLNLICFDFEKSPFCDSESLQDSWKEASCVLEGGKWWRNAGGAVKGFFSLNKFCFIAGKPCAKFASSAPSVGKSLNTLKSCHNVTLFLLVRAKFKFCKSVANQKLCTQRTTFVQLVAELFVKHEGLISALKDCLQCKQRKTDGEIKTDVNASRSSPLKIAVLTAKTTEWARPDGKTSRSPINEAAMAAKTRNKEARTDGKPSRSPLPCFTFSTSNPALHRCWIEKESNSNNKSV